MKMTVLGVGDLGATGAPGEGLKTFALGSCVAVVLYDFRLKVAGMAHVALPASTTNASRAQALPGYFADSGVPALLNAMFSLRGSSDPKGLIAKIVGGASIMKVQTKFNIGQRNIEAVRKELMRKRLSPMAEDVGGVISRTVAIDVNTGMVLINSPGRGEWTL